MCIVPFELQRMARHKFSCSTIYSGVVKVHGFLPLQNYKTGSNDCYLSEIVNTSTNMPFSLTVTILVPRESIFISPILC